MIYLNASLTIKPDTLNQVIAAAKPCIEATRREPGCIRYDLTVDVNDPTKLVFVEKWETREALESHFAQPHLETWREAGKPFITDVSIDIIHPEKVEKL